MGLVQRTVTGTIKKTDGTVWASAVVEFKPVFIINDGITVPVERITVTTDGSGLFSLSLYTFTTAVQRYFVTLPSGEQYQFDLSDGVGSIDLSTLILQNLAAIAPSAAAALEVLLQTRNASIQFKDEAVNLGTSGTATTIDFTGAAVTASRVGNAITVNIPGGGAPTGAAGGVLGGTYPNPSFAVDMATQAELDASAATKQPLDTDLTDIAGLAPSNDDILQRKAGAWINRTIAQVKVDLAYPDDALNLKRASNLSDLNNAATARTNLGLVIGTNVQAQNANLEQLAGLADPNADRLFFWDDSAGSYAFLTLGTGLSITGTTINAAGVVDGSGSANRVAFWLDADTLTSSANYTFDGNSLNVATSSPSAVPLTIDGHASQTAFLFRIGKGGNPAYFRIDSNGNIADIGGMGKRIQGNSSGVSFPDGLIVGQIPSFANSTAIFDMNNASYPFTFKQRTDGNGRGLTVVADDVPLVPIFEVCDSGYAGKVTVDTLFNVGIGVNSSIAAKLQVRSTTEQARFEYDASNYFKATVGSTGGVTFDAVGSGAKFTFSDAVDITSSLQCDSIVNDTGLAQGTYTPTRSAEANITGTVTTFASRYGRVGNMVFVGGRFTATPTLTATATSFEIDLPVASNIGAVEDLFGDGFCGAIAGMGCSIEGSVANNTAVFKWVSSDITAKSWSYHFSYAVI